MRTNIAELRVYIREKPTDEACRAEAHKGWSGGGYEGRHHRTAINVNTSVNTPRDVFHKAWISRCLLILVIVGTCSLDALNVVSWWRGVGERCLEAAGMKSARMEQ